MYNVFIDKCPSAYYGKQQLSQPTLRIIVNVQPGRERGEGGGESFLCIAQTEVSTYLILFHWKYTLLSLLKQLNNIIGRFTARHRNSSSVN